MTPETLQQVKIDIRKFYSVVEPIADYWTSPHNRSMIVLMQNMGFDGSESEGYNYDKEVKKMNDLENIFKYIAKYYDSHFERWIYDEISMIIMGAVMSEGQETYDEVGEW